MICTHGITGKLYFEESGKSFKLENIAIEVNAGYYGADYIVLDFTSSWHVNFIQDEYRIVLYYGNSFCASKLISFVGEEASYSLSSNRYRLTFLINDTSIFCENEITDLILIVRKANKMEKTSEKYSANYLFMPDVKKIIFNGPATIVLWKDGTKTIVKAHNEDVDPEKGLAMAIAERYFGNYSKFKKAIKDHMEDK